MLVLLIAAAWYFLYFKRHNGAINAMPADVFCMMEISDNPAFLASLDHDASLREFGAMEMFGSMYQDYRLFSAIMGSDPDLKADFAAGTLLAGSFATGKEGVATLFLLELSEAKGLKMQNLVPALNKIQPEVSTHTFEREQIYEMYYTGLETRFSFAIVQNILIYSTTPVLVENAILQFKKGNPVSENAAFSKVFGALSGNGPFRIFWNLPKLSEYIGRYAEVSFYDAVSEIAGFGTWMGFTVSNSADGLQINGYCAADTDEGNTLSTYSGQYSADMHPAVPANTAVLYRVLTDHLAERISSKLTNEVLNRRFFDHWSAWMGPQLLVGISESLDAAFMSRAFVIIPATDSKLGMSHLDKIVNYDTLEWRGFRTFSIADAEIVQAISGMHTPDTLFGAWVEDACVLAFSKPQLLRMLESAAGKTTLHLQADYLKLRTQVSATFNASVFLQLNASEQIARSIFSEKVADSTFQLMRKFPALELQFTQLDDLFIVNGFLQNDQAESKQPGSLWATSIGNPIIRGPFVVYNDATGLHNILVQDSAHVLYLLSPGGDMLWRTPLDAPMRSAPHPVDFYGNGKTQFLFNTDLSIYLMNIRGEMVEGFPITLTTTMTNPLGIAVSGKGDHRFFVACNNGNVYGYYKDGKPIPGWNPLRNVGKVQQPIVAFKDKANWFFALIGEHEVEVRGENGNVVARNTLSDPAMKAALLDSNLIISGNSGKVFIMPLTEKRFTGFTVAESTQLMEFVPAKRDSSLVFLTLQEDYIKLLDISGGTIFTHQPAGALSSLFALQFRDEPVYGYAMDNGRLMLLDNSGMPRTGFPAEGSAQSIVADLTGNGDVVLITVSEDRIFAYRLQ